MTEPQRFLDLLDRESLLRSTDDALAMVLPLFEQVAAAHARGKVAPLEGVDDIFAIANRLYFEEARAIAPKDAHEAVARLARDPSRAFDVVEHHRRVDDDDGSTYTNLSVVEPGTTLDRPAYVTRFVSWEHELGHHDPLTDIYVLGLVLASIALDKNLGEAEQLSDFVRTRTKLSSMAARVHPVVLRVIVRMTELDRSRRAQDLVGVIGTLRTYREQGIVHDEPTAAVPANAEPLERQQRIYGHLRDRLFDFSRRNRLLHFVPSGQTLNLTLASVPLVLDVKNVDPNTVLTWNGRAAQEIASTKPVPLGRYLRFEDYPYVASALDQLRLDALRARNEVGFSPLRLALCFLHWHDLKEAKDVRITSPLLLLPIELEKKKGVRDAVFMTATTTEAEVNPVLRQRLLQLYAVKLPDRVDLSDSESMSRFIEIVQEGVMASEPAVAIRVHDRPRIDFVLAQAKRRLEAYRKRVSLSGRLARSHRGFDYSYARSKLHPLGAQMFAQLVYPAAAPNRDLHEGPRPQIFQVQPTIDSPEKTFYALKDGATEGGPYEWSIDLCSVTLANFNYRKMSLVRDYTALLEESQIHESLEALFARDARPVLSEPPVASIAESYAVMPSDPTQTTAVARARAGTSFIIQGPPGTGKSQTIANLVADYVARGKRVLFVCEKRAAIDVVHHRLSTRGLAPLCTLIHDSQGDKREFIKNLKETYESFIATPASSEKESARSQEVTRLGDLLTRAERFREAMREPAIGADEPLLDVLGRASALDAESPISLRDEETPTPRELAASSSTVRSIEAALVAIGRDRRLGAHALRLLSDDALAAAEPVKLVRAEVPSLRATIDEVVDSALARVGATSTMGALFQRIQLMLDLRPLVEARALALLDDDGEARRRFVEVATKLRARLAELKKATDRARGWNKALSLDETESALTLARSFESTLFSRLFAWLSPSFWRLRRVLRSSFDFASRAVQPSWTEILERLRERLAAEAAARELRDEAKEALSIGDVESVEALLSRTDDGPDPDFRSWLANGAKSTEATVLLRIAEGSRSLPKRMATFVRDAATRPPSALKDALASIERDVGDLTAVLEGLRALALPGREKVGAALRAYPATFEQLERAVLRHSAQLSLQVRAAHLLSSNDWDDLVRSSVAADGSLQRANAAAVVERARNRFLDRVKQSSLPTSAIPKAERAERKSYATGRKDLEHEFGKMVRHRSIRDLATGDCGRVVRDLKPVWLMSPLSVADTLPLAPTFDVVIFDEASQIPLEDAIPAAHRAKQVIVVGDEMQLPPTDFFGARADDDDDHDLRALGFELDASSLLSHAAKNLPSTMLGWHYRSRDEALIRFSNRVFYEGRLLTIPSVRGASPHAPIVVRDASSGAAGASALLERSLSHHRMEDSPYEQRRNAKEARYIAELLRGLLARGGRETIGIVAFSEAQQDEIESAIRDLGADDEAFRNRYEAEVEREEDGQHVGLFVKNLENVQGDERDIIIVSVCYGPDARGKMLMNFGPINKTGGEKRLNVIFSRAKKHLALVSSIRWTAITNEYNDGANCLRSYLRYAEAMSVGDRQQAEVALAHYREADRGADTAAAPTIASRIASQLRERGHAVDVGVGSSRFRCDLAVRRKDEPGYDLGILVDDRHRHERPIAEVMVAQPSILEGFGWKTMTVLHRDWFEDSALVIRRIEEALGAARSPEPSDLDGRDATHVT